MMKMKRPIWFVFLFFLVQIGQAQVNLYVGGNLQGNYSWMRGENVSFEPGFGGGFSFIYWEYEYWYLKTGLDYSLKRSSSLEYPEDFNEPVTQPDDKVQISFREQSIGIPVAVYFRPYESGANALLISGSFSLMYVAHLKESTDEFGELVLSGGDIKQKLKTNVGIGAGFQRQLDRHTYLNIIPSFNLDIRSPRAFQSITLTAELIFGVY
jgi:hypothetical protein